MPVELQMQKMVLAMKLASGGNAKNNQRKNLLKKIHGRRERAY
jgi:hypothetical protein